MMPEQETVRRARRDEREGKAPSTQAGEFVREEIEHVREGKHGARSSKQAIAIGLSKARRAGVDLPPPKKGKVSKAAERKIRADLKAGHETGKKPSPGRSRATKAALKREGKSAASKHALSTHARKAAGKRSAADRSASARKAAKTRAAKKHSRATR